MLGKGNVLRVPVTRDGRDELLTVVIDEVAPGKDGTECHLSAGQAGIWVPQALLCSAIAEAAIAIDPGLPSATREVSLPH